MIRRLRTLTIGLVLGGGFYLLLVDTTSTPELYVLAATAIVCGAVFEISREQGFAEGTIRLRWLLGAWRILAKIGPDIAVLCWEALRQLVRPRARRGTFRAVPFGAAKQTAEDTGRRALTEWLGSLAPNTIVVGVDARRRLLLVHQLRRQGKADDVDPMGLG